MLFFVVVVFFNRTKIKKMENGTNSLIVLGLYVMYVLNEEFKAFAK